MADVQPTPDAQQVADVVPTPQISPVDQAVLEISQNVALLEKTIATGEARYTVRALRNSSAIRGKLNLEIISKSVDKFLPKDHPTTSLILASLGVNEEMEVDESAEGSSKPITPLPETESYLGLLALFHLFDQKLFAIGAKLAQRLVERATSQNRRTLDPLVAKIFAYLSACQEAIGHLDEVRGFLLNALRTATLHHDEECQATLLNLLLRNYLHFNLLDQAVKLVSKTTFPETAGNNQFARFHYYLGKIKAIQLDYTESHKDLMQAIRKAPKAPKAAGFQQAVYKLYVIVRLLLGEIPERSIFRQPVLRKSLAPYLSITQAVRVGDLLAFQKAMQEFGDQFQKDKTYTLILRLRHNVIKTGIRMISLSYSRISLAEIQKKLHLDSEEDAEFIVAKAIRDGVIDASIDHQGRFMRSKEILDLYSTNEPQESFHQRITFCLNLRNEAVKALRFPPNAHKKDVESAEERREREQQEKELVHELVEDDDDIF